MANQSTHSATRNNFGQLLLMSIIEALIVSILSGLTNHSHPTVNVICTDAPMCVLTDAEQQQFCPSVTDDNHHTSKQLQ